MRCGYLPRFVQASAIPGGDSLPKKVSDDKLLSALITEGSVSQAAQKCGLHRDTIYKRLADPAFRAVYDATQGAILAGVTAYIGNSLDRAVETLTAILDDVTASPGVKVSAADSLLRHGLRYVEIAQLEARISALERDSGVIE